MRFLVCCFAMLLFTATFARQIGGATSATKAPATQLTAEAYRDLIVKIADAMARIGTLGQVAPGEGTIDVEGRQIPCIMMFTLTDSAAQNIGNRRKTWASARVPKALEASHAEISKWIGSVEAKARSAPKCFVPLMQASAEQFGVFGLLGEYDDLRKNAATAVSGMGVTLPPIEKPTPEKK